MPEDQLSLITLKGGSTPLVNDDALAARLAVPLKAVLGERTVVTDFPPATGSEDVHLLIGPKVDPKAKSVGKIAVVAMCDILRKPK